MDTQQAPYLADSDVEGLDCLGTHRHYNVIGWYFIENLDKAMEDNGDPGDEDEEVDDQPQAAVPEHPQAPFLVQLQPQLPSGLQPVPPYEPFKHPAPLQERQIHLPPDS
jgi:hypothetical protein